MHKMLVRWNLQNLQYFLINMGGSKAFTKRKIYNHSRASGLDGFPAINCNRD